MSVETTFVEEVRKQNAAYFHEKTKKYHPILNSVGPSERKALYEKLEAIEKEFYKAVEQNKTEKVEQILSTKSPVPDINFPLAKGSTPLMVSANEGHLEMTKLLLSHGAMVNVPASNSQRTALMNAARHGHLDIVNLLLYHGADPRRPSTEMYWSYKTEKLEYKTAIYLAEDAMKKLEKMKEKKPGMKRGISPEEKESQLEKYRQIVDVLQQVSLNMEMGRTKPAPILGMT